MTEGPYYLDLNLVRYESQSRESTSKSLTTGVVSGAKGEGSRTTFFNFDTGLGQAIKFTESLGYKGLYSIEVSRHEGVRIVYNTILANLA